MRFASWTAALSTASASVSSRKTTMGCAAQGPVRSSSATRRSMVVMGFVSVQLAQHVAANARHGYHAPSTEHRRGHATAFSTFWSLRVNACMPAIKRPFMLTRLIALPRCSWRMLCPFDLVWAVARAALQHRREVTADC